MSTLIYHLIVFTINNATSLATCKYNKSHSYFWFENIVYGPTSTVLVISTSTKDVTKADKIIQNASY